MGVISVMDSFAKQRLEILIAASDTGIFWMDIWKKKYYFIYVFNSIEKISLSTNG